MNNASVQAQSFGLYTYLSQKMSYTCEKIEETSVGFLKKVTIIVSPLSTSLPISYITRIADKALKVANYFKTPSVLPMLSNSLIGMHDIVNVGSFLNLALGWFPILTEKNFNEAKIEKFCNSDVLDPICAANGLTEEKNRLARRKLKNRIVKQIKLSLKSKHSVKAVRADVVLMLMEKEKAPRHLAESLTSQMTIRAKKTPVVEKIYNIFFMITGTHNILTIFDKWGFFNYSKIAQSIGNSRITQSLLKAAGSKFTKFIVQYSLSDFAKISGLIGLTIKLVYDGYKLYQIHQKVKKLDKDSPERLQAVAERTNKIWAVALDCLLMAGGVVPLILSVNPAALLVYELGVLTLGLINAVRQL